MTKSLELNSWDMAFPNWVHFSIVPFDDLKFGVTADINIDDEEVPEGDEKWVIVPVGGIYETVEDALEWIKTIGVHVFFCGHDDEVYVTGSNGDISHTIALEDDSEAQQE